MLIEGDVQQYIQSSPRFCRLPTGQGSCPEAHKTNEMNTILPEHLFFN